ncbi:MAG TPA: cyclic nucleotide-binding domain-containing protein [Candidatus Saccharimonadales bacterium]|nr:cyclic nucleotide-binding domain-containing protein [Candidatus Saccharimonadales bacterium]
MAAFRKLIANPGTDGTAGRMEAARLMGEVDDPEFPGYLSKLIREDSSIPVIQEALAAAGKRKDPTLLREVIMRLCCPKTKSWARRALIEYGEAAVEPLREALLDSNLPRDIRLGIPRTLSKIASPAALDALLSGLNQEDGSLRYRIILGLEEMARRLPNLRIDRAVIEMAIVAEASRYYHRFLTFFVLFGDDNNHSMNNGSLLHQALLENMEREKERVLRLLSLIYPPEDIGSATAALRSDIPAKQAQAIEFLDNLLTGDVKRYVFPLYDDAPDAERFQKLLALLGLRSFDRETAFQELLKQDDVWLKAATFWEIGLRGLRDFRGEIQQYLKSKNPVLKETAALCCQGSNLSTKKNLTTIEKVIFLKSVDIFEHATVEQLGRIAAFTEEVHFEPGEIIFNEGEPGDAFYLLLNGRVFIERSGNILREMKEKEAFGTLEVLDFHPRAVTAKAVDQVRALKLNGEGFHDLLSLDIEMVQAVFRMLCGLVRRILTLVP